MSKFFKYENDYINLDHVIKVELDALSGGKIYDINIHLNDKKGSFIQLRTNDSSIAKALFDKIGSRIKAKDLIDFEEMGLELKPNKFIESVK